MISLLMVLFFFFSDWYYDAWASPNNGYLGHFPTRDEKEHSDRRRVVNNVYSLSSVLESEKSIEQCTQLFCETMHDFLEKGVMDDLSLWINMQVLVPNVYFGGSSRIQKNAGGRLFSPVGTLLMYSVSSSTARCLAP